MNLYLLRHAKVVKSHEKAYNGWIDLDIDPIESKLIENVKAQLSTLDFDKVYASSLKRTQQSLYALGYKQYLIDGRLKEIRFLPEVDGYTFAEIEKNINIPKAAMKDLHTWCEFIIDESQETFRARIQNFLQELQGDNILICAHAGTIRMILSIVYEKEFFSLFESEKVENLSLTKVSL